MRAFALAIAALLLLSACSDDPEPIEPKPSASAKPAASAPTLPGKAKDETPEGAVAFVAYWIDAFNFAVNSGDAEAFSELNEAKCTGCKSYADEILNLNNGAAEVRGFAWTAGKASLDENRRLEVAIRSGDYEVRDSDSEEWSTVRASKYQLGFQLSWDDRRWRVRQLYIPNEAE